MGLDITAYSNVIESNEERHCFMVYANNDFPGRAEGLVDRGYYECDEHFGFRAGSYSGYNQWREQLAELAGWPPVSVQGYGGGEYMSCAGSAFQATEGPFWELINFSDCEGAIGHVVAKKLSADFEWFREQASKHGDPYFFEKYQMWAKAFGMAADNGAVIFH